MNKRQAKKEYYYHEYLGIPTYEYSYDSGYQKYTRKKTKKYSYLKTLTKEVTELNARISRRIYGRYQRVRCHTLDRLRHKGKKIVKDDDEL